MTQRQKKQAEKILNTINRQTFADFYNEGGEFDDFITARIECDTKKDRNKIKNNLLKRIVELFDLK